MVAIYRMVRHQMKKSTLGATDSASVIMRRKHQNTKFMSILDLSLYYSAEVNRKTIAESNIT